MAPGKTPPEALRLLDDDHPTSEQLVPSVQQAVESACGPVLAAGATCSITVTFQPTAYGTFTSTLTVVESSGVRDTVSVTGNSSPDS